MTSAVDESEAGRVREAERADLLAVFSIEKASFSQPWPFRAFERYLSEPGFLVAVDDGDVVGYVVANQVSNHGRRLGHVKDIAVHPDRRGEGFGTRLLGRAMAVLGTTDARRVKLEVRKGNESAVSLYREFGFEHHHTVPGYYDDGEDALVMVADL